MEVNPCDVREPVENPDHTTLYPLVVNGVFPIPVHITPLMEYATVLVPYPVATHVPLNGFQAIPVPCVVNGVGNATFHVVVLYE